MIELLEVKKNTAKGEIINHCPKCGQAAFPQGAFFQSPIIKIKTQVKLFFFILPINLSFEVHYCPNCGYLAIKEIKL